MEKTQLTSALIAPQGQARSVPWAYTRRKLAERWGIPPWEVDRVPWSEIRLELEIQHTEAKAAEIKKRRGNQIPLNELE